MPTEIPRSEIYQRVFAISVDGRSCGTSFALPINGEHCLITAAHVIQGLEEGKKTKLKIFKNNQWLEIDAIPYFCNSNIDIAIIKTPIPSERKPTNITLDMGGVILGQDSFFLGFPYFGTNIQPKIEECNDGFPLPFFKKATISAIHEPLIYFDGHNNPGFSGGPLIFWNHAEKQHKLMGVVSAYLAQSGEIKVIETSVNAFYEENSGIGVAYHMKYAKDLIEEVYKQKL